VMRTEKFFSLLNQSYRKKSTISPDKRTPGWLFQFKFGKLDLKVLNKSKFEDVDL